MQLGRLNHVGVATPSIAKSVETYRLLLGAEKIGEPFDLPAQGVKVSFVPAGGQHHVCFEVPDIHEAAAHMKANGATVLGEPRIGAHGTPIVFVHPKDFGGMLVELMETPKGDH